MTYKRHWYFCHFLKRLIWYKIYSRRFNNKVVRGPKVCIVLYEKIIGSLFQAIYEVVKVKLKKNGLVIPAFTHILRIHDLSSYPSRWLILYPFFLCSFHRSYWNKKNGWNITSFWYLTFDPSYLPLHPGQ